MMAHTCSLCCWFVALPDTLHPKRIGAGNCAQPDNVRERGGAPITTYEGRTCARWLNAPGEAEC